MYLGKKKQVDAMAVVSPFNHCRLDWHREAMIQRDNKIARLNNDLWEKQ